MRAPRPRRRRLLALLATGCTLAALIAFTLAALSHTRDGPVFVATPMATNTAVTAGPTIAVAGAIQTTLDVGGVDVALRVGSPALGPTSLSVTLRRGTRMLSGARVRIRLTMPAFPSLGAATYRLASMPGGYTAAGSFVALGRWQAWVVAQVPGIRRPVQARFDLLVGAGAGFVALAPVKARFGPATVAYAADDGSGVVRIHLRPGLRVRYLFTMPSMPEMGHAAFAMDARAGGWYSATIVFGMSGVTAIEIEVHDHGTWQPARRLLFDAGSANKGVLFATSPIVN